MHSCSCQLKKYLLLFWCVSSFLFACIILLFVATATVSLLQSSQLKLHTSLRLEPEAFLFFIAETPHFPSSWTGRPLGSVCFLDQQTVLDRVFIRRWLDRQIWWGAGLSFLQRSCKRYQTVLDRSLWVASGRVLEYLLSNKDGEKTKPSKQVIQFMESNGWFDLTWRRLLKPISWCTSA